MKRNKQNFYFMLIIIVLFIFLAKFLSTTISKLSISKNSTNSNINSNIQNNINDTNKTNDTNNSNSHYDNNNNISNTTYKVLKVVDGDTIKIKYNNKIERLRFIGIDTPESVSPDKSKNCEEGKIASNFTKNYLEGKVIQIELDVQQRDKYGRLLAYVYINNQMYNEILLEQGYAKIATFPPNVKYVNDFTELQKEARNNKKGFWSYYYK